MNSIIYIEAMDCQTLPQNIMTLLSHSFKVRHLILAAALTTGPGFVNPANAEIAFLVDLNSRTAIDLGNLGGWSSYAYGINNAGQVVGTSFTADGNFHAFITSPDGEGMTDLNSLVDLPQGVILSEAMDINNSGQVIANANAIPEPEAYALMLAGLGLVGFMVRRKRGELTKRKRSYAKRAPSRYPAIQCQNRHAEVPGHVLRRDTAGQ